MQFPLRVGLPHMGGGVAITLCHHCDRHPWVCVCLVPMAIHNHPDQMWSLLYFKQGSSSLYDFIYCMSE